MPQPNMQAGMPGQTPQPGYGTPGQTPQQGYGMPGQGVQPGMQAGMPGQTPQPGYGMPGQNVQPGYGMPQQPAGGNQPRKKKKTGLIVGLIILAVVLIGGVIFAFMKFGKKDGKGSSKDAEAKLNHILPTDRIVMIAHLFLCMTYTAQKMDPWDNSWIHSFLFYTNGNSSTSTVFFVVSGFPTRDCPFLSSTTTAFFAEASSTRSVGKIDIA